MPGSIPECQEAGARPGSTPGSPVRSVSPLYRIVLSLVVASGLILLIFGAYEAVERLWLGHLEHETLRLIHRMRGIVTALVVGVTVGWAVIRTSPALLTATALEENGSPEAVREGRIRLYAHWFIAMRWIAVLVAAILAFLGVRVFELLPGEAWWPLVATVGVLAGCNVFYTVRIRYPGQARSLVVIQVYGDLAIFTVLLVLSGGVGNPLATFMLFQVIIGGILLSQVECYRIAAAGAIMYAGLAIGTWSGVLPHYPLRLAPNSGGVQAAMDLPYVSAAIGLHTAVLFLAAYFVNTLSERLRRNERRLSALADRAVADRLLLEQALQTTCTGLRVLSPELVPIWANDRWKGWFGESATECWIFPDFRGKICPAEKCLDKGELDFHEIERPGPDSPAEAAGKQVFQITSAPIHDGRGRVTQVVQLAHDITEQKEAHVRMLRAGQMAAVGELAGQVAHEVNNPIAIISAKANLLLKNHRGELSDKVSGELSKIVDCSDRVARIAQGLLSYSRPSPTTRTEIDLRLPIRKSISMIEHRARNRNIAIADRLPDEPVPVTANTAEMEQVFLNLLINAVQAMSDGGRLTVSLQGAAGGNGVEDGVLAVAVDDTGPGIPAGMRERVFEPFYTTKQEQHGTGLGLSICQGLLRSHGGGIQILDAPGGGARFLVCLPRPASAPEQAAVRSVAS